MQIKIIGAGLAGCEAALWLADHGVQVDLYEQKPVKFSPAHKSAGFAELICSNSLKAERPDSASGLLKIEMRMMGSHLLNAAETARVAAGGALAVDRDVFSTAVTEMVEKNSGITVHREEVTALDESVPVLVASGPLTEGVLAEQIAALHGGIHQLHAKHHKHADGQQRHAGGVNVRHVRRGKYIQCRTQVEAEVAFLQNSCADAVPCVNKAAPKPGKVRQHAILFLGLHVQLTLRRWCS